MPTLFTFFQLICTKKLKNFAIGNLQLNESFGIPHVNYGNLKSVWYPVFKIVAGYRDPSLSLSHFQLARHLSMLDKLNLMEVRLQQLWKVYSNNMGINLNSSLKPPLASKQFVCPKNS